IRRCFPVGELHEEKWKVAFVPRVTPVANHRLKQMRVEIGPLRPGVALSLIPDDALDREGCERRDHAVVESRRRPSFEVRMPRGPRLRLAFRPGLRDGLLILALFPLKTQNLVCTLSGHLGPRGKDWHQ